MNYNHVLSAVLHNKYKQLHCATADAYIDYTRIAGDTSHWKPVQALV